jgi:hypothetical protein
MASTLPATGTEISMGRIGQALGLGTAGTIAVGLNAQLGTSRGNNLSGVPAKASGSITNESGDFGGLQTSGTY